MMISREQVGKAFQYLRTPAGSVAATKCVSAPDPVSPEFLTHLHAVIDNYPDTCEDRIARGKAFMAGQGASSDEVAEKILGRMVSDSLR